MSVHVHIRPPVTYTTTDAHGRQATITLRRAVDAYDEDGDWLGTSYHATEQEAKDRAAELRKAGKYVRT